MEAARERVYALMEKAQAGNMARVRSAAVVAFLMAALLWFTKWPTLRPGLLILLCGQIVLILILLQRRVLLARKIERWHASFPERDPFAEWFDGEVRFTTRLGIIEDLIRTIGFLTLGYGFWIATGSVLIALALGVVYPAFAYFGMERKKRQRAKRALQAEKDAVNALLAAQTHYQS